MQVSFFCANGYLARRALVFHRRQTSRWLQPVKHGAQEGKQ